MLNESNRLENGADVVSFLKGQHEQVNALFGVVLNSHGEAKRRSFDELRHLLAAHEAGEAAIVHPTAAASIPNGEVIVRDRRHEERKAQRQFVTLEHLDVDSVEFDDKLRVLQAAVLDHAALEEQYEFDKLPSRIDPAQLVAMREAVESVEAEAAAPSR